MNTCCLPCWGAWSRVWARWYGYCYSLIFHFKIIHQMQEICLSIKMINAIQHLVFFVCLYLLILGWSIIFLKDLLVASLNT